MTSESKIAENPRMVQMVQIDNCQLYALDDRGNVWVEKADENGWPYWGLYIPNDLDRESRNGK